MRQNHFAIGDLKKQTGMNKNYVGDDSWLKAAVIGSIWASFEVIFGTFLHNMRLPFAGTFLTFFSLVLLISFSSKWNDKYLFVKAGLICALMRSMLPTSIMMGPLIGIMTEAIIFQLVINLLGRNYFSFVLAGVLSMLSAVIHKVISILIIYGFDIVKILENMYFVFLKSTKLELPPNQLLIIILFIYLLLGIASAIIGVKVQKELADEKKYFGKHIELEDIKKIKVFETNKFHFNKSLIFVMFAILLLELVLLERYSFHNSLIVIVPFMIFSIYRYGNSLRRLSKPIFWMQLIIIVLFSTFFWSNRLEGLIIGLKMITRAILVVTVFTSISVELKNPVVKALMFRKGFSGLYSTIGLATNAVPFLMNNIVTSKTTFTSPIKVLKKAIILSDRLLQSFKEHLKENKKIMVITGSIKSGKTTFLIKYLKSLKKENNMIIGGVIAHGIDKNGERLGFEIENIATGERELFCNRIEEEGDIHFGRFYFKKKGIDFGEQALNNAINNSNLLVIDEIGPLELNKKVWYDVIQKAIATENLNMVWVVRKKILNRVLNTWGQINIEVINVK